MLCGGGARFPSASAKAAGWGLAGLEFGVNIPGTAGGAVRMNANAYGGQLARVLEWVDVCTAAGCERRGPAALGFSYRSSNLGPGEVVSRVSFRLRAGEPAAIRATLAEMRGAPRGPAFRDQDLRLDLQEPGGRSAPRDARAGQLLEAAGCRGLRHGGARFSEKHANFVENTGTATTADDPRADGRGTPTGARALRRRARAGGPGPGRGRLVRGLGAVRRRLLRALGLIVLVIVIAFVYQRVFGGATVEPHLVSSEPVAVIGSGGEAVAVADDGTILTWLAVPEKSGLPSLALDTPPKGRRVQGPVLEQVHVLAAAPPALRPYVAGSHFGESGVDVELTSGIELIFGSATRGCAQVASRSGSACRPVNYSARLCKPACPRTSHGRWLWAYTSAHRMNPRPQG